MNEVLWNMLAFLLGGCAGSLSGLSLLQQTTIFKSVGSRYVALFPIMRLISLGALVFYLLHWGTIPFILFGVSMLITMWIVILTFN